MHLTARFLLCISVVAGAWLENLQADEPVPPKSGEQRFDFLDDRDQRRLAEIRVALVEKEGKPALQVVISAVGPRVDPIPGFRGIRGANRFTAEQLDFILSGKFPIAVRTQSSGGTGTWSGEIRAGKRGRLPERRLLADGRIDYLGVTAREYPLEIIVTTAVNGSAEHTTEILHNQAPRLRLKFRVEGGELTILQLESLSPPPWAALLAAKPGLAAGGPDKKPGKPPEIGLDPKDWTGRDLDGKWAWYQKNIGANDKKFAGLVAVLARRGDFEFLEGLALYNMDGQRRVAAAKALAKAGAPQWLRVAAWQRRWLARGGHEEDQFKVILVKHDPAAAFSWLEKYKEQAVPPKSPVKQDYDFLKKKGMKPKDVSKLAPPLKPAEVFRHLDPPAEVSEFGILTRAAAGKVYVEQVLRAMDGVLGAGAYEEPWLGKFLTLTRHRNERIRQAAYLTFTYTAGDWDVKRLPLAEFTKVMDDAAQSAKVREAALLGYSYFAYHPQVFLKLHHLSLSPKHPAWRAAVSRLRDVGSPFTLVHLAQLDENKLAEKDRQLLVSVRAGISEWQKNQKADDWKYSVRSWVERAAWAQLKNDPLVMPLTTWTVKELVRLPSLLIDEELRALLREYQPNLGLSAEDGGALQTRVQALARDIAEARKKRK